MTLVYQMTCYLAAIVSTFFTGYLFGHSKGYDKGEEDGIEKGIQACKFTQWTLIEDTNTKKKNTKKKSNGDNK